MPCSTEQVACAETGRSDRGATAVEYALMILLVAGIIIAVIGLLGQDVVGLFQQADW